MTEGITFGVSLTDGVSGPATRGADTLRKFGAALSTARTQLAFYESQLARANSLGDIEGHNRYGAMASRAREQVYSLADAIGPGGVPPEAKQPKDQAHGLFRIVEPVEIARHAVEEFGRGFQRMGTALKSADVGGVVEGATESLAGLASTLDLVVPGLGQVASAAIKATGAITGFTAEIIESGVETALEVSQVNSTLKATFDALGTQGPESGEKTIGMLNRLSSRLPQSREKLAEYTKEFEALGITDLGQLEYQVRATASAQAILGDSGAAAYEHLSRKIHLAVEAGQGLKLGERALERIYAAGSNATDVADRLGISVRQLRQRLEAGTMNAVAFGNALSASLTDKGQKPIEAMMASWDGLKMKGAEVWHHLFDDIDVTPLTNAIAMVVDLGNKGEPSGQGLRKGITAGLNGIIRALGEATIQGAAFFLHLEASAIRLETKLRPLERWVTRIGHAMASMSGGGSFEVRKETPQSGFWSKLLHFGVLDGTADPKVASKLGPASAPWIRGQYAGGGREDLTGMADFVPRATPEKKYIRSGAVSTENMAAMAPKTEDHSIHIQTVQITAPEGVTDAHDVTVTGLGDALERMQLMGAR